MNQRSRNWKAKPLDWSEKPQVELPLSQWNHHVLERLSEGRVDIERGLGALVPLY